MAISDTGYNSQDKKGGRRFRGSITKAPAPTQGTNKPGGEQISGLAVTKAPNLGTSLSIPPASQPPIPGGGNPGMRPGGMPPPAAPPRNMNLTDFSLNQPQGGGITPVNPAGGAVPMGGYPQPGTPQWMQMLQQLQAQMGGQSGGGATPPTNNLMNPPLPRFGFTGRG